MLIRFDVSNFLSFNKSTEFNSFSGDYRRLDNHIENHKSIDILKLTAIYGANASGKSNLIKAISYLKNSVLRGEISKNGLSTFKGNDSKSSVFELEFLSEGKAYIYGLEILKDLVKKEYLYFSGLGKTDKLIFERKVSKKGVSQIEVAPKFIKLKKSKILKTHYEEKISPKKTFIGVLKNLENESLSIESDSIYEWFKNMQIIFPDSRPKWLVKNLLKNEYFREFSKDILCKFDTGIKDLHIKSFPLENYYGEDDKEEAKSILKDLEDDVTEMGIILGLDLFAIMENGKPVVKKLLIEHIAFGKDKLFSLDEESDGTKRLIEFLIMIYSLTVHANRSKKRCVFIIDEIGRSIHPSLLKGFLKKLSIESNLSGQLIFTTHESNLLDLNMLRPDEIWFAEKNNKVGNTEFRTLAEYKKIRKDLDIRNGYLKGRFGAIPMLAGLDQLNWTEYAAN